MNNTPWIDLLTAKIGEHEISGKADNPFIMDLYQYGNYPREHDETPWCAVTVDWALELSGYLSTRRADAASYIKYGIACEIKVGCIVVIEHADGSHHVTFCVAIILNEDGNIILDCLGGNQSDSIKISRYHFEPGKDQIAATRWPIAKGQTV